MKNLFVDEGSVVVHVDNITELVEKCREEGVPVIVVKGSLILQNTYGAGAKNVYVEDCKGRGCKA